MSKTENIGVPSKNNLVGVEKEHRSSILDDTVTKTRQWRAVPSQGLATAHYSEVKISKHAKQFVKEEELVEKAVWLILPGNSINTKPYDPTSREARETWNKWDKDLDKPEDPKSATHIDMEVDE